MTEKVVQVTEERSIIELTKEELEEIKNEERLSGWNDVCQYINFCYDHYYYEKKSISAIFEFVKETIWFVRFERKYIKNTRRLDFFQWKDKYRQ